MPEFPEEKEGARIDVVERIWLFFQAGETGGDVLIQRKIWRRSLSISMRRAAKIDETLSMSTLK